MLRAIKWKNFDTVLLGSVVILLSFGVIVIRSAVAGNPSLQNSDFKQVIYGIIGTVLIFLLSAINYKIWATLSKTIYSVVVVLLIVLNLIAPAIFGSARWFDLGSFSIQPSELAKIAMIITMAGYFSTERENINSYGYIARSFILALGITIWVILQPNLSTSIVLLVIWFSMLWMSGLSTKVLLSIMLVIGIAAAIIIPISIKTNIIKPYQVDRVISFVVFSSGNQDYSSEYSDAYNINQALISIGSGGLYGQGYNQGSQIQGRFLRVRQSDFIFATIGNEFGFAGCVGVIIAELFIVLRCIKVARCAKDKYGALLAFGVSILLLLQSAVNIGVNLQVLPVTGLTLPFISYGGSSLITNMMGIGLVESVSVHSE
jgi:rod shape determining protein RodA